MKRKFFLTFLTFVSFLATLIFTFMGIEPLDSGEHEKLKQGKLFWEWHSPYGKLNTHYVEAGSGDRHIFLIHGFRAHTFTWRHLIKPLAEAGYHVWAIDLIGYGLSDKPDDVPYDVNFFVSQIVAFMEAKNIPSAHMGGNSMGGGIVLKLAVEQPAKVSSLTLISALGYPLKFPLYLAITRHIPHFWKPFLGPTMVKNSLRYIIHKTEKISSEQVDAYYLPYRLPGGANATLSTLKQYDNKKLYELCQKYSNIQQPTLIIWGEYDSLIPLNHFNKFQKDFPKAKSMVLQNCGHIAQEEEPEHVIDAMREFLAELDG
jgi:pimeloyl-ACP methyl ester carboxylesterase